MLRIPRTRQPVWNSAPRIDWENPLTRGLVYADPGGFGRNLVTGQPSSALTGTKVQPSQSGIVRGFGSTYGTGTTDANVTSLTTYATNRTYLVRAMRNGAGGATFGRLFDKRTSGAQSELLFYDSTSSAFVYGRTRSIQAGQWSPTGVTWATGQILTIAVTYDSASTANDPLFYFNGVAAAWVTETLTPSGSLTDNSDAFVLGNRTNDNARNWDGWIGEFLVWDRILTPAEVLSVSQNPWQIFEPQTIWVGTAAAAGSTGTVAVTEANDTSSASGTTTVVGSSSVTEANDTSSASGTTTIVGTSAVTEQDDTSAASGTTTVTGTAAPTEENDTSAASGTSGSPTGTVDVTEEDDTSSASGSTPAAQTGGGGWLPSYPTKEEREAYIRRQRESLGIIPKKSPVLVKAIKKVAQKAARRGAEPSIDDVREIVAFEPRNTRQIADALAINYRIYLSLLDRDRIEREKTRQFIEQQIELARANAIALETAMRLQEEEEVFVVMSLLLSD